MHCVHGTQNAIVSDNTCFNFHGHGILLEDGNEEGTKIEHNLVVLAKKAIKGLELLQSEQKDAVLDRFPSPAGIWISNPQNDVVRNVVISSEGTGIWMAFATNLCCTNSGCLGDKTSSSDCKGKFLETHKLNTGKFDDNVAASSVVGMNWDGAPVGNLVGNPRNPNGDREILVSHYQPSRVPTFKGNIMYKNSMRSLYFRGEQAIFVGSIFADNGGAPLFAFNQVLRNTLIVGWSPNAEMEFFHSQVSGETRVDMKARKDAFGLNIYDGPFVLDNCFFAGFPTVPVIRDGGAQNTVSYSPKVLRSVGAAQRFGNVAKRVTFLDARAADLFDLSKSGQAASLYDVEGGITGRKGVTVTGAGAFNAVDGCTSASPTSFAITCTNYKVGTVTALNALPDNGMNFKVVRVPSTGGPPLDSHPSYLTNDIKFFQVITSRARTIFAITLHGSALRWNAAVFLP